MKNRLILMLLIVLLLFSLCGCDSSFISGDEISVVTSNYPAYCFAKEVCSDNAKVTLLLPAGSESHTYEPTGKDMVTIQNCDLFIYTGGESDNWIDTVLSSLDKDINTLKMIDCVDLLKIGAHQEHNHEPKNDIENSLNANIEYDTHVWTSPLNAVKITRSICDKMCVIDSKNKTNYEENTNEYILQLEKLHKDFTDFFDNIENKVMVFGDRFPLIYFAHEYGIEYASAFPGCAEHSEPSATEISKLIDKINSENISTIYYIEFSNQNIANTIAEATGAKTALFYTCHNVSKEQFNKGIDYISLMRDNLNTLQKSMK